LSLELTRTILGKSACFSYWGSTLCLSCLPVPRSPRPSSSLSAPPGLSPTQHPSPRQPSIDSITAARGNPNLIILRAGVFDPSSQQLDVTASAPPPTRLRLMRSCNSSRRNPMHARRSRRARHRLPRLCAQQRLLRSPQRCVSRRTAREPGRALGRQCTSVDENSTRHCGRDGV